MKSTKLLAASLATATLLTVAGPTMAYSRDHLRFPQNIAYVYQPRFTDLNGCAWAELGIEKAYQLGLMLGVGQGRFNPQGNLTREQAVVAAIRLVGLENQAKAEANVPLHFTDARNVDDYAHGAIAVAVERGMLPPAGDGALRPHDPASRLWVSVLLVKALGYDAEAQSKMNVQLSFSDAGLIPANLVGYVQTAVDHKLITGYPDGSFRPTRAVTRAEMAALLGRADGDQNNRGNRAGELQGTITAVNLSNGSLTIQGARGTITAYLAASGAVVFINNAASSFGALQAGMTAWVKLNANLEITLIDATGNVTNPTTQTISGTVTAVVPASNGYLAGLTILPSGGTPVTAAVAPSATITLNGAASSFSALQTGQQVQVTLTNGLITQIAITSGADISTVQGTALAFYAPAGNNPGILFFMPQGSSTVTPYNITAGVPVYQGTSAVSYSAVTPNAHVLLTLRSGSVIQVNLLP